MVRKSARQPRSTQIPRLSKPQVWPWIQGEPLCWFVSLTPRRVFAGQYTRFPFIKGAGNGYPAGPARATGSTWSPASPQVKIGPSTAIHPDTQPAEAPGLPLDARRAAALINHLYPAAGVNPAQCRFIKLKFLKGTAFRPYITNLEAVRL
jgi:hypothetical protein